MSVNDIQDREERPPYVRFETRPVQSKAESLKQGRYIAIDVDYVLLTSPGSKDCVIHKVDYWLNTLCVQNVSNNRIPAKWLDNWRNMYDKFKQGQEVPVDGTSVKNWPSASPAEVKNMIGANIRTIEDMALCNDEGLKRLGMGAMELRNKAKAYMKAATDHGPLVEQNAQLIRDNARMEKQVEFLTSKVNQLSAQVQGKAEAVPRETFETVSHSAISASELLDEPVEVQTGKNPDTMTDPELKEAYEVKFGKKPHWKMNPETIRAKLK